MIIPAIFLVFFAVFVYLSFWSMIYVPMYDFDEAHRAENAKRMKEYGSFFVPLTGSSQDRIERLKIPFRQNPDFYLYYHLERPPLVYILMMISTSIFGNHEWAYRLPSFLMGMLIITAYFLFAKRNSSGNVISVYVGLLSLSSAGCLWLSSQYAQMDTSITFFLFLSLLVLMLYCSNKKSIIGILSGVFFGLGLLSKLQPAVIFLFPIAYLIFTKRLEVKGIAKFALGALLVFLPWVVYLIAKFGVWDVINIMPGFAITSASVLNIHHQAPIFWYARWWWDMMRPGWTLFLALFLYDLVSGKLDWQKKTLLSYIFGGLLAFSLPVNKVWWYVLPLVPAIAYSIFLSARDYLKLDPNKITNLSLAIIIAALPIFLEVSNTLSLTYGILVTGIVFLVLIDRLNIKIGFKKGKTLFFCTALSLSLLFFISHFPKIVPYHRNTKGVAEYYKNLPYPKCLWLGDMPGEAALFYSDAGEIPLLNKETQIFSDCKNNYLITPERSKEGQLILRQGNMRLYKL